MRFFNCFICTFLLNVTLVSNALARDSAGEEFEQPPVLAASQVVDKKLLKGPNHTVQPQVKNDGYLNHFVIQSKFGAMNARGEVKLAKRVQEIYALEILAEKYPSSTVAADAAYETGKGIVMAPVRGAEKLYDTVSDSEKLEKTARSIPGGIANLFGVAAQAVSDGAEFVYETSSSVASADSAKTSDQFEKAQRTATKAALDYIGYNDAQKQLIRELRVDPYTDNELLRSEIRRVASIKSGAKVGGKFLPGIPGIPYVGTVNKYVSHAESAASYEDPEKVEKLNQEIAHTLGLNEGEGKKSYKQLSESEVFTPPLRHAFLQNLKRLENVKALEMFVTMASRAKSREVARLYVTASGSLADYHEKEEPLLTLVSEVVVPAGISKSGELVIPLPVDHLVWTKDVATVFKDLKTRAKGNVINRMEVRLAGSISPLAEKNLTALGANEIKKNLGYS